MPKMLKAAAHLLNPLIKFDADGTAHNVTAKAIAVAAQSTWVLITNLSNINKLVTKPQSTTTCQYNKYNITKEYASINETRA